MLVMYNYYLREESREWLRRCQICYIASLLKTHINLSTLNCKIFPRPFFLKSRNLAQNGFYRWFLMNSWALSLAFINWECHWACLEIVNHWVILSYDFNASLIYTIEQFPSCSSYGIYELCEGASSRANCDNNVTTETPLRVLTWDICPMFIPGS